MLTKQYCIWAAVIPLGYEGLPIIVLYMQHIKHFKARKIVKINEGPDEARSGYAELVLPLYSNSGSTLGN